MAHEISTQERQLCEFLRDLPREYKNRYSEQAENVLLQSLFWSLAGGNKDYLRLFFPDNTRPLPNATWKLRKAQGGTDGDEFTEAARGKACGHIFKSGEATYRCKTCSADDTCVLCSRCYDSSDHTGHMVYVSVSMGNSGCCDCGDPEAWRQPVHCTIHAANTEETNRKGKAAGLPEDLVESIRMTIGRMFDYICDVISCSPEQLRLPKSEDGILLDEKMSRLTAQYYSRDIEEEPCEFALLLWNDEKHTVNEVRDQVARACKVSMAEGLQRAHQTDDIGRSIIKYSYDVSELLRVSKIIEQIKVTVTIRSARDTFREQMCGTIIEWLSDIAGCSVGPDHNILRQVICEEMLKPWSTGSQASNMEVGMHGIDDHDFDDQHNYREALISQNTLIMRRTLAAVARDSDDDSSDDDEVVGVQVGGELVDDDIDDDFDEDGADDAMSVSDVSEEALNEPFIVSAVVPAVEPLARPENTTTTDVDGDVDMLADIIEQDVAMEAEEATLAGYPPPPPPPPPPPAPAPARRNTRTNLRDVATPSASDSDTAEQQPQPLIRNSLYERANMEIPKTPNVAIPDDEVEKPARYWLETPPGFIDDQWVPPHEDIRQRLRLDWLIEFDLRMWKKVRVDLRDLYISTVVSLPQFKRILGLRFAGLYTKLAQLYLIADREPDHSIINISLQMLTTASITAEIVERGNFLTNLMAILYTFLTTRQVGHPHEIRPGAVLAFDSGSVTNRRMYHFFMDLRYLFGSEHVQSKLRTDDRYMLQFLDLVKLHQGICPNIRAIGEHVEYETDAWISASLITREINRLCRQFSEAFKWNIGEDPTYIYKAIRFAARAVILNSLGTERKRFTQAEIKDEIKFKRVGDYEFDTADLSNSVLQHTVVKFVVESQPISFHHALHYTLSWLIESGKSMPREKLTELLSFTSAELQQKPKAMGQKNMFYPKQYSPEDHLLAAFDYPLRVCAWLAQMKASMWVRNGMSLRHQSGTYRGVSQRDVSHHRDIFLLQTAMVVCSPSRVLVSMIDRYGLEHWMKGIYEQKSEGLDDGQVLDVTEDLIQLLIVLLSDRTSLISTLEEPNPHVLAMRRDIIHVLCFKPLSFSEICTKLPDKFQDQEECQDILDEMTTFKPPEGLSDVGTFELKEQFLADIDPYIAHYTKNNREESENAYKTWYSKMNGVRMADIVFEPRLRPIESGAFSDLSAFTRTGIFAQIIYYSLLYPLKAEELTPTVPLTRVEAFLQVVLHLVLLAISEDKSEEDGMSEDSAQSFVYTSLTSTARSNFLKTAPASRTIAAILEILSQKDAFKTCHPKIGLVLKRMKQKRPNQFEAAFARLGVSVDRISTASPAINTEIADRKRKKQEAQNRAAKVMAQFQAQQKSFLDNQGGDINWGEDDISEGTLEEELDQKTYIPFPSGTCILCQEDTKDGRLYGTFGLMMKSTMLRQTDFSDPDFLREVQTSPDSLDRSAENIRPFGVAGENREKVNKFTSKGERITTERHFIGKGFPSNSTQTGPVSVGCGHIMHYKCFDNYYEATTRRHQHQIARHHPELLEQNEFVCPLCKALGNAFLPVIWAPKEEIDLDALQTATPFETWLPTVYGPHATRRQVEINEPAPGPGGKRATMSLFHKNVKDTISGPIAEKASQLLLDAWESPSPHYSHSHVSALPPFRLAPAINEGNAIPWDAPIVDPVPVPHDHDPATPVSPVKELVDIYRRLRNTMSQNELPTRHDPGDWGEDWEATAADYDDLSSSDTLAHSLGYSISAVEIQHRGVAASSGTTILESISHSAITHLRVLAETASSYVSVGGLRSSGANIVAKEYGRDYERQYLQLFLTVPHVIIDPLDWSDKRLVEIRSSLLHEDTFIFLTECSLCLAPVDNINIMHLVRLCYLAEILKTIMLVSRNIPEINPRRNIPEINPRITASGGFGQLLRSVEIADEEDGWHETYSAIDAITRTKIPLDVASFVKAYALSFLRKAAVLIHVRYGVAFHNHIPSDPNDTELVRLTEMLRLPSFDEVCSINLGDRDQSSLGHLARNWMREAAEFAKRKSRLTGVMPVMSVSHPTIFELVGLPKNYDTLMEETMKRRCPTTGKDVSDPMLCLFCGDIFCGQSICCLKQGPERPGKRTQQIGGAQQHMLKCQKNIGLFINIRKCCVYYVHNQSGSWNVAPYIDKYGEMDPGLRHNRQLFLNQKRYDALIRTTWLSHGVPSIISRKLEMDINNGGWETI